MALSEITVDSLLSAVLAEEKEYMDHFFARLDLKKAENILQSMAACQGTVFFTGVGKSGFIARKIAATFVSIGVRAAFLSPLDALHGDLGSIGSADLAILLSKSGETDELVQLLPYLRAKGAGRIAWVCKAESRLSKGCDLTIELPLKRELCPHDLAPTTSTVVQLIFGNVLAVGYMRMKGVSIEEFALNHPAGRIGRRIALKVRDVMVCGQALPVCRPNDLLADVLVELSNKRCGCLLVQDASGRLQGIFTDGDLRRALQSKKTGVLSEPVSALMTRTPKTCGGEMLAWQALQIMEEDARHPITVLPVAEEGRLVGLIRMHDILQSGL